MGRVRSGKPAYARTIHKLDNRATADRGVQSIQTTEPNQSFATIQTSVDQLSATMILAYAHVLPTHTSEALLSGTRAL